MKGGPVRAPQTEMSAEQKQQMRAELEATGLLEKAKAGRPAEAPQRFPPWPRVAGGDRTPRAKCGGSAAL